MVGVNGAIMTNSVQQGPWISSKCLRAATSVMALLFVLVSGLVATQSAQAQAFTVLHSFTGSDGAAPYAGLVRDGMGNLYGTTSAGGAYAHGTVFKLDITGKLTILHSFAGGDGAFPTGRLIRDYKGNLYGTTFDGGISNHGVVFELNPVGQQTMLYRFTGGSDGQYPYAGLLREAGGNLYGTTLRGGSGTGYCDPPGCGVVFKLDVTGKETVLYNFQWQEDGADPLGNLVMDGQGNLYGTTEIGGGKERRIAPKSTVGRCSS
jgi:uncharacterized repeat protein (TIGR03803 family)